MTNAQAYAKVGGPNTPCPWTAGATQTHPTEPPSSLGNTNTSNGHNGFGGGIGRSRSTRIGMRVNETPSPNPPDLAMESPMQTHTQSFVSSQYQKRLLSSNSAEAVESVLAASCAAMGFDIAEMWFRTGRKTHQLIHSHLRHSNLDETLRDQLIEVYYGDSASDRTHKLSPALCKKAKEDNDVVWVTAQTESGAKALKCSLNGVLTAVAVPVCHEDSSTNMTVIYFSVKRATMRPEAIEFLVHMSLAAAVAGVNSFSDDGPNERVQQTKNMQFPLSGPAVGSSVSKSSNGHPSNSLSTNGPLRPQSADHTHTLDANGHKLLAPDRQHDAIATSRGIRPIPADERSIPRASGADLNLTWSDLRGIEYLTDGGNSWIHTAIMGSNSVVIKQLRPEVQDVPGAIDEIEDELRVHSQLSHENIVRLFGAGFTTNKSRFLVMERLDGGTLTQQLGYENRIRDRRRRFWKKQKMPYVKVLDIAKQLAVAMDYCHRHAVPGSMILHRDLKPDNIGLTLGGVVKLIDFGLARVVENASPDSDDLYEMSGETGSLRYMAPEVASGNSYNQKADVYSFGIILWELNSYEKPFEGMHREEFYEKVVHGGNRPEIPRKFPEDLSNLIQSCWSTEPEERPNFSKVVEILGAMYSKETRGKEEKKPRNLVALFQKANSSRSTKDKRTLRDRHSTWF